MVKVFFLIWKQQTKAIVVEVVMVKLLSSCIVHPPPTIQQSRPYSKEANDQHCSSSGHIPKSRVGSARENCNHTLLSRRLDSPSRSFSPSQPQADLVNYKIICYLRELLLWPTRSPCVSGWTDSGEHSKKTPKSELTFTFPGELHGW